MPINSRFVDYSHIKTKTKEVSREVINSIHDKFSQWGQPLKIMHVCGTHEATVARSGMRSLLPKDLRIIAGPGCPVCVCPSDHISKAAALAREGNIVCSFGDMFKVPDGSLQTLAQVKAEGNDIRLVYSVREAQKIAQENPEKNIVWLGVGFETTAPMTSFILENNPPDNFYVLTDFRLVPPALDFLVNLPVFDLDGFILPGHVTTIMGTDEYEIYPSRDKVSCVVAGFDPLDFLVAMDHMLDFILSGEPALFNAYPRAVKPAGNVLAKKSMSKVFKTVDAKWRGVGIIEKSGFELSNSFQQFDANHLLTTEIEEVSDLPRGCLCGLVILGQREPQECPHFLRRCTPATAIGPCMVSDEGTCRIRATYQEVLV